MLEASTMNSPIISSTKCSKSFLLLSPTETVSTASSPGLSDKDWDILETPSYRPVTKSKFEPQTPLTPPSTYKDVYKEDTSIFVSRLSFSPPLADQRMETGKMEVLMSHAEVKTGGMWVANEDYFQPKKLIRNLTKELQAITDETTAIAQSGYSRKPSFNFSSPTNLTFPINFPKVKNYKKFKNDIIRLQAKTESNKVDIETQVISQNQKTSEGLANILEHILPFNLYDRLKLKPYHCVGSLVKNPNQRCSNKARGPLACVDKILRTMSSLDKETNYKDILDQVEKLVEAVMCGSHINAALSNSKANSRMIKIRKLTSDLATLSTEDRLAMRTWIKAILSCDSSSDLQSITTTYPYMDKTSATSRSGTAQSTPTSLDKTTAETSYLPKFVSYQPKWSLNRSVTQALLHVIANPLKPTDLKDGFIYIFWDKEHFGKVKIGRTNDLEHRLEGWNQQCKRTHSYHKATTDGQLARIPHVSRIERLIHIELKEYRLRRGCEGCNKTHEEWFDVEEAQAVKVFQKWQDWILQSPYAYDPDLKVWRIRSEMVDTLPQICEPVPLCSTQQGPGVRRVGAKHKGLRKVGR